MRYGLTKSSVSGQSAPRRAAMRVAAGMSALLVATALALVGISPASAESRAAAHLLKIGEYDTHPLRAGGLMNHGGPVETAPVVYIDFWGWTSDPSGEQPYLTGFYPAVSGSAWLSVVDQYGGSSNVTLGGTWVDPAAVPTSPTDAQIQAEAVNAATHFGSGNSVNVQIIVATPTGHSTSGFGTQWCSYHGAVAADPDITYTNLPYMTDAGASCGAGSVTGRALDGVSIVASVELVDVITDPLLNGWYDVNGEEAADVCGWPSSHDIVNGYPVAPFWNNSAGYCM